MHCLELSRIPAKVICVLRVIHLPDLILGQLHIIELMVIEIKIVLSRYLLLILLIGELIVHRGLLLFAKSLHTWSQGHHGMCLPWHLVSR